MAFLYREWNSKHPIIDLSLYRKRNFAMSQIVMVAIGAALYSTTVMIPNSCRKCWATTATDAGMALSAGALVLIVLLPIVGFIGQKVDPRLMITFGFCLLTFGIWRIGNLDLGIGFGTRSVGASSWYSACHSCSCPLASCPTLGFLRIKIMRFPA